MSRQNAQNITNPFLESLQLAGREGVGFPDDRNYVDTRRETAHQFNVHFTKSLRQERSVS